MKILCVIDSLGSGGAQRQLVELSKGFKERNHDVTFLIYHNFLFFKRELNESGIDVKLIEERNYLLRIYKLRKFIRLGKYDGVLSFLEAANFISTLSGFPYRKWKLIVGERSANPNIRKSLKLSVYRLFHIFTDYVVSNSYKNIQIVRIINPLIRKKKIKVIYNIVNLPVFRKKDYCDIQNKIETKITIAASYRAVKNLDGVIDAVALMPMKYRTRLFINWFGNKDIENTSRKYLFDQKQKIINYGLSQNILLNDSTSNIFEEYIDSDFIGLFSHYEGFPNSLCEGMMLGKPIISTRVSDVPKFIKENESGFLCDSFDPLSIMNALINSIKADSATRKTMGKLNMKTANKEFNRENIIDNYLDLFNTI